MTHIMVDLETWGTAPGSALRSIGAVAFDPNTGETGPEFYVNISDTSCEACGLVRDPRTVAWWAEQSEEARQALTDNGQPLADALVSFAQFWRENDGTEFWAFGPNFDETLLAAAYRALGQDNPWHYRAPRCARTLLALTGIEISRARGVHHNALDDAKNQVAAVAAAYRVLWPREAA